MVDPVMPRERRKYDDMNIALHYCGDEKASNQAFWRFITGSIKCCDQDACGAVEKCNGSDVALSCLSWPFGTDPEITVYNGNLYLLEASSHEELDSVFKGLHKESDSEPIFKTIEGKTKAVLDEKDVSGAVRNQTETDTELQFLEARSIKDINFAFNQLIKGGLENSVIPDVESPESLVREMPLKSTGSHSELYVVDTETLEDIHSALRQLTDDTAKKPLKELQELI